MYELEGTYFFTVKISKSFLTFEFCVNQGQNNVYLILCEVLYRILSETITTRINLSKILRDTQFKSDLI